ncbi:hypothetical protein ACJX0J_016146, partial [Zea mays]
TTTHYWQLIPLQLIIGIFMQQDDKDRKNEIVIEGFEDKIKKLEHSLKEKDSLLRLAEGSLAEAHSQNEKLSKELEKSWTKISLPLCFYFIFFLTIFLNTLAFKTLENHFWNFFVQRSTV